MSKRTLAVIGAVVVIVVVVLVLVFALPKRTPESPKELALSELIFCSEQPAWKGNYEKQPNATYKVGDTIWLYVEVDGLKNKKLDGDHRVDVTFAVTVMDANGNTVQHPWLAQKVTDYLTERDVSGSEWLRLCMYSYRIEDKPARAEVYPPGKYTVSVDATDEVAGETKNVRGNFYVEG